MEKNKITYNIYKYILGAIFLIYYRPKFVNKKYIPKEGPIIVAGNHIHLFDQCLPILSTRRMIHYMAKREYFDGKLAWFFKSSGCISVDRGNKENAKIAVNTATNLLKNGYAVGIFPEGTRNKTNDLLLNFKIGTVKMATETNATIGVLNEEMLSLMKENSVLVNVGRGSLIVTRDLIEILKQNKIKGAVLDVFEAEPIPQGSEIWDMENVIITPHIAGPSFRGDEATKDKIWKICFENIESYLCGGTLKNVVDFDRGY